MGLLGLLKILCALLSNQLYVAVKFVDRNLTCSVQISLKVDFANGKRVRTCQERKDQKDVLHWIGEVVG